MASVILRLRRRHDGLRRAPSALAGGWCGRRLHVHVIAGRPVEGRTVALWLPETACDNVHQQFCPGANVFGDHEHWQGSHVDAGRPTGRIFTLADAAELGRRWWSTDSGCCPTATGSQAP